jgi:hypothetical protein
MADPTLQSFVLARLADFCDRRVRKDLEDEQPIPYLLSKLKEIEPLLYTLKQQLYEDALIDFFRRADAGGVDQRTLEDFVFFLERYLSPGDFVDAVFDLTLEQLKAPPSRERLAQILRGIKAHRLLDQEELPLERRRPSWERLVREFYKRLDYDRLYAVARRKPLTEMRLQRIVRRVQSNVGEFCAVLRHPRGPDDFFTPFMTPRVEGLIAASRRFLLQLRALK